MAANPKHYDRMMDSGVEWLGEVPAHWEVRRLGQIGAFSKGRGGSKEDEQQSGVPCIRYGDLYTTHQYFIHQSRSFIAQARSLRYTLIKWGDVLFAASGETTEEIGKSAVNLIRSEVRCGGDIILFRPNREISPKFLGYATDSQPAIAQKALMGRGFTVVHIYTSQLKRLSLALPPFREQADIARFLDHMDRRIQKYIRAKEKLIVLLDEYKQTLIHQAVTGQTDVRTGEPYPEYKESGVDWLGRIPKHWQNPRLRSLVDINTGGRDTINREDKGRYPFFVRSQTVERINTWSFDGEAVLTAGDGVGVGKVFHYANEKFDYHQRVYKFSGFRAILGRFFFHYFRSTLRHEVLQGTAKSTVDSLRLPMLQNFPIALPPWHEQTAIVQYLEHAPRNIDSTTVGIQRSIDLFQEYRARLIADVVTGKLDVRDAVADLPEFDSLDDVEASAVLNPNSTPGLDEASALA